MRIAVLRIDLGKNSCSIVALDHGGAVVLRRRMRREGVIKLAGKLAWAVLRHNESFRSADSATA